jgi:hypothetical protein
MIVFWVRSSITIPVGVAVVAIAIAAVLMPA